MPSNRLTSMNPWILPFLLGLVLGVCLFHPSLVSKAFALDANSSLFDQNQTAPSKDKPSQPLALPEVASNQTPGVFGSLLHILFSLILIVGLILLTVWGLKTIRDKWGWNHLAEEGKPIKVLTSTYLAPRKTLHLVEVGNRILVVGVGNEEVNCLDVIRDPAEVESLRQATQQGFPKVFNRILRKDDTLHQEAETRRILEEGSRMVGGYVDKLKKISSKRKSGSTKTDGES